MCDTNDRDDTIDVAIDDIRNRIRGRKCYDVHREYDVTCCRSHCRLWIDDVNVNNCIFIALRDHDRPMYTLRQTADILNLTRAKVSQIEKDSLTKVKHSIFKTSSPQSQKASCNDG